MFALRSLALLVCLALPLGGPDPALAQSSDREPCGASGRLPDIDFCSRFIAGPAFSRQTPANQAIFLTNRGAAYLARGQFEPAIKDLTRAIAIKPDHLTAYRNRAFAYGSTEQFAAAIRDYDVILARIPNDMDALGNRGIAYSRSGQDDRAIVDFDKAIGLKPNDADLFSNRAIAYAAKGQWERALPDLDRAIELNPTLAHRFNLRGRAHLELKQTERAIADFRYALTMPKTSEHWDAAMKSARAQLDRLGVPHVAQAVTAQTDRVPAYRPSSGQGTAAPLRRVALVIGNAAYPTQPLANAGNDARAVAASLRDVMKFDAVTLATDLTRNQMVTALQRFQTEASAADVALVYYSGHGNERPGRDNFLIPIDAKLAQEHDLDDEAISLGSIQTRIAGARQLAMVILDACRSSPFQLRSQTRDRTRGLARPKPEGNMLIAFATSENDVADDGVGRHSPFTTALLKHLPTADLEVRLLLGRVRDEVKLLTRDKQLPAIYGSLGGTEIYLAQR